MLMLRCCPSQIFGEVGPPIPQDDDELDEESQPLRPDRTSEDDVAARPLRRSISSHPRFLSAEERDAREAAIKVAKMQERERRSTWGIFGGGGQGFSSEGRRSVFSIFGSSNTSPAHESTGYSAVTRDEQ